MAAKIKKSFQSKGLFYFNNFKKIITVNVMAMISFSHQKRFKSKKITS